VVDLFISHSSRDLAVVELLVRLLRNALNLLPKQIRCTSLDGYRLPAGANFGRQLRQEVVEARVLVGVVSARSFESAYVLFELGARWGAQQPIIPLLAPGTRPDVLRGPISELNALRCDRPGQLYQLVTDIAEMLGVEPNPPAAYHADLQQIADHVARLPPDVEAAGADTEAAADRARLGPAVEVMSALLAVNDLLADDRPALMAYQDFLEPFVAVSSASEQAIVGVGSTDPRWLALNARDRDLARRESNNITLLEHDALWFRDTDLRQYPIANLPIFAAGLVHQDQRYDNQRLRTRLAACARVAAALGQDVELPAEWPASFYFADFARETGRGELADALDRVRAAHSLRAIGNAVDQLAGFCADQGVADTDCTPARVLRLLGMPTS
jgi:TIR domain